MKGSTSSFSLIQLPLSARALVPNSALQPLPVASSILSPSYLSFDWALSFYGLIPEKVVAITSATLRVRKNKTFINYFLRYQNLQVKYRLNYFVVTDGASGISNTGNPAVEHARKCHIEWELANGIDPMHDWSGKNTD